ncbi:QWxxN domain [Enterococcus faecium]|uniref:QWxxN domain n=1 Tax=Enterococcus faecium TaxID=1352 RepID=UPI0015606F49|nr:QWxxN domain [Enterococcus faecium]EGP5687320.1 hypothetical protein [Enterococcus faecium]EME8087191.1 QWxxN domain [Enterococcus faecium]EME8197912.1 QWxxN domain [Enterococcus faecium]NRE53853.1 QWxxN domain [Enterococcus faecium]
MPNDINQHRAKVGKYTSETQTPFGLERNQRALNELAASMGQRPTREGLKTLSGYLYVYSILSALTLPDPPPNQSKNVQKSSRSIRRRQETPTNTTRVREFHPESLSQNQFVTLTDAARQWSLEIQQLAQGITMFSNHLPDKATESQSEQGVREKERKQSDFRNIRQTAITESQKLNGGRSEETNEATPSFSKHPNKNSSDYFSGKDAAEKLIQTFQASFEETQKQSDLVPRETAPPIEKAFWEDLTTTFYNFFSQFEHTSYTENQADVSGSSVMDHFIHLMKRTFSDNPTPINQDGSLKSESILKQEEASISAQLWQLTNDLGNLLSGFVQSLDVIQHLGAQAIPISEEQQNTPDENVAMTEPMMSDESVDKRTNQLDSPTLSTADLETEQVHHINETIITDQLPSTRYQEPLPVFFYDRALFQRKNETSHVNEKIKEFFMKEKLANDATPESELPEIARAWMENKNLDKLSQLERKHFLAYTLLKNYGMENVRWGEFISANKLQDIFLQWKTNTWLEDYTYKAITDKTSQYDLSGADPVLITSFNEYQKEGKQLFNEFINDLPGTIPKTQELSPIYYSEELFDAREKTEKVNEEVWYFLVNQNFVKDIQTRRELVQKLQEWILSGENYEIKLVRQQLAAEVICLNYGMTVEKMSPIEARLYLLQWENNNAQAGYSFKTFDILEKQEVGKNTTDQAIEAVFIEQEIATFLQENDIEVPPPNKKLLPELDEDQKEKQREKVSSFLIEHGIACENHEPQQLIKGITHWLLLKEAPTKPTSSVSTALEEVTANPTTSASTALEETIPETLYDVKIKQLANILLGKKEEESLSEEEASGIVSRWIIEMELDRRSSTALPDTSRVKRSLAPPTSTQKENPWQSQKLMSQVERLFREQGVLSGEVTKEKRLIAMSKWLLHQDGDTVFRTDKLHTLAQVILKELNLYGGKEEEKISDKDAEVTVMKWLFEHVLGCSLEEHLARNIVAMPDPSKMTVNHLRAQLEYSPYEMGLSFDYLPLKEKAGAFTFKTLWEASLKQTLPSLYRPDDLSEGKRLVSDQKLLVQLTGDKLLEREEYRTKINESEKSSLGAVFLDSVAEKKELNFEELQVIFMPALFATAQLEPERLREALTEGTYKEVALSTFISYWQKGYFKLVEKQETIDHLFQNYQEATLKWRRKQVLAEETIRECYKSKASLKGYPPPLLVYYGALPVTETDAIARYISGGHPCPTAHWEVPNLDEWYKDLTGNVADAYAKLDTKLIELAFETMNQDESQFLFSEETQIYEASAKIKRKKFKRIPVIGLGGDIQYKLEAVYTDGDLKKTDLFVAKRGDEERVYGLKKLENEGGYVVYRVDQDPSLYVKYQLFEINSHEPTYDTFSLNVNLNSERFKNMDFQSSEKGKLSVFALRLSHKHRHELYDKLYQSGDEKTPLEKAFDVLTHIVPFYDCVTGIIEQDIEKAVPSCLIDVALLIPVAGEAVALSTKFGLGVAKAIARGGLRSALRNSGHFLPTSVELGKLGVSIVRYIDPGVELITDSSKLMAKGLAKLSTKVRSTEIKNLLEKLEKLEKQTPSISENFVKARLPKNGPEVPVKRVDEHLYVRVTDLQTGNGFGDYYLLKNNQLEVFKGPVSFSEEQKRLIDIVAIKIKDNQKVIDEKNLNPAAYGEGRIRTVLEEGEPDQFLIKMNDQWVPVRETPIVGHGVRYDAKIGEELFPVNFNGMEWYFEAKTSPFMAEKVRTSIGKQLEKFETRQDPMNLSAPDERGLMRDDSGRSYIKIENHYVPLILLDKEAGRYHLVKKDANEPMTVLRFHPESGQFQVETPLEKKLWQEERGIREASYIQIETAISLENSPKIEPLNPKIQPEPSRPRGGSQPGSSKPGTSGPRLQSQYTINGLPVIQDRADEWNKLRQAKVYLPLPKQARKVNSKEKPKKLYDFIPTQPIEVTVQKEIDNLFLEYTREYLKSHPQNSFRVFAGLDASKTPDFLKPFQVELALEFENTKIIYDNMKKTCQRLSRKKAISDTREGKYLIQMFELENVPNQEQILKKIIERLRSIAEKGEQFLQKTTDIGFENVWIVTTDLKRDYFSQSYVSEFPEGYIVNAFVFPDDPQCRIFILADAFHLDPDIIPRLELRPVPSETIIHETTHLSSYTGDLIVYRRRPRSFASSGQDVLKDYKNKFSDALSSPYFEDFVDRLAEYQKLPKLSKEAVAKALTSNEKKMKKKMNMLRANLQLEDAEMVMTIIRDLSQGRDFDVRPRVRRNLSSKKSEEDKGMMFLNLSLGFLFNPEQYWLSPHLHKTQEKSALATEHPVSTHTEESSKKDTTNTKGEKWEETEKLQKRSLLDAVDKGKNRSHTVNNDLLKQNAERNQKNVPLSASLN